MALLMVAAEAGEPFDPYAAIVEPHCVHDADGIFVPTVDQSLARGDVMIPDHD